MHTEEQACISVTSPEDMVQCGALVPLPITGSRTLVAIPFGCTPRNHHPYVHPCEP
ncbi:hypothetical protein K523DRAFT_140721 [Schizophyllum commune Tattone D]|nr:hypothetical protein K523DRAFT_140721 [Schizophyllum commune Tattone D]